MSTDKNLGRPEQDQILELLRRLLENEKIAKLTIRDYLNRQDDLQCEQYVWTVACTFELGAGSGR